MFDFLRPNKNTTPAYIGFNTDIHSHLLPGIDDGCSTTDESLELISRMQAMGITRFITTPHIADVSFPNTIVEISGAYEVLQQAIRENKVEVDLTYSVEYRLDEKFNDYFVENKLIPFPNNYLLIENSYYQPYWTLDDMIFRLSTAGYKPILAHPERYVYYHKDTNVYDRLYAQGCKFQVNILSLSGGYGKETKEAAYYLLNNNYIDFLATDAHHTRHIAAIEEFIQTSDYEKILSKLTLLNDTI
jgi:tyrosine-protein phosphatase YwqE